MRVPYADRLSGLHTAPEGPGLGSHAAGSIAGMPRVIFSGVDVTPKKAGTIGTNLPNLLFVSHNVEVVLETLLPKILMTEKFWAGLM
jgi:hypothetical protein